MGTKDIKALVDQLQEDSTSLENGEAGARERMIEQAHQLIASLELPSEAIQRMGWAEPAKLAQCQIAADIGIFEALAKHSPEPVDVKTLATTTKASEVLVSRLMKHLAAVNVVREVSADSYAQTTLSAALTEARFRDGIKYVREVAGPSFQALPRYFKNTGYDNPTQLADGPFQFAHQTKLPFFAWLGENPDYLQAFNSYMGAYRAGKPTWTAPGFFPVSTGLVDGFQGGNGSDDDAVLLVDVGGGLGHDLEELKAKHPDLPGRLILQDREEVISTLDSGAAASRPFEATAHDFFTPQPVRGARAYYLHSVLHDWSDDDCVKILSNLVPALRQGYSKVLINEIVVPTAGASWPVTSMDWLMLGLGAMRERTQAAWESIVARAGLKVTNIYTYELGTESLIEAELA